MGNYCPSARSPSLWGQDALSKSALRPERYVFASTYEAQDVHLGARSPVAALFDNLQRIAPVVKKVGREVLLSY